MYQHRIKRILDFLFALILLIPAFVIVSFCYAAIKIETKGPAFFVQERPGYKGKIFKIYKLRTMRVETEENGRKLNDAERITRIGGIIRTYSFDELPQLLNVLKGEMSFIGPRPLLPEYLPLYSKEQMRRHDVLPGISGFRSTGILPISHLFSLPCACLNPFGTDPGYTPFPARHPAQDHIGWL